MNILITICARGGSKGVKDKNIRLLAGKPLIAYTLEVAKKWAQASKPEVSTIICSTDSERIAEVARQFGAEIPFIRPAELATDSMGKIDVIRHALINCEKKYNLKYDFIVDLDCTNPIRTVEDLDHCLKIFQEKDADFLLSVVNARKNPYFNLLELNKNGFAEVSKKLDQKIVRRQDAPKVYDANASIYFYKRDFLLNSESSAPLNSNKVAIYLMEDDSAIDIDTELDFKIVEKILEQKGSEIKDEFKPALLFPRNKLVENVLLIEGCGRTGKFLMGNMLYGFEGIEHYQYNELTESLPYLMRYNLLNQEIGKTMIQSQIDSCVFNRLQGRNFNFRLSDKSCIYNNPKVQEYLKRTLETERGDIVKLVKNGNTYFAFLIHELLPNVNIYFEMYPSLKIIHLERNPIDLVYSWYHRGWGQKLGDNPLILSFFMQGPQGPVPWFSYDWKDEYESLGEMDRAIKTITHFIGLERKAYSLLSEDQKKKIHCLTYENLLTETDTEMEKISVFLGKKILPEMRMVKSREMLPTTHPRNMREEKLKVIQEKASLEYFIQLKKLGEEYDHHNGLLKVVKN